MKVSLAQSVLRGAFRTRCHRLGLGAFPSEYSDLIFLLVSIHISPFIFVSAAVQACVE